MKKLINWFTKKTADKELAPQLTRWERQALRRPGPSTGGHPYLTYTSMMDDAMVQTALTIKKLGVVSSPWKIVPSADTARARQNASFIEEAFARMEGSPLTILTAAMQAFAHGWSIQESVYLYDSGRWWLQALRPKDVSLFGLEVDRFGKIEGLRLELPEEDPLDLPLTKFVVYANRSGSHSPRGRSDLDAAYRHWVAKGDLLRAWQLHLERFASPSMVASYGTASTSEQEDMLNALNNLASSSALVHSGEFQVSSVGGQSEASHGFIEAIDYHNREIARAVLGQTLTTDEGRRVGSLALGKVHLQVMVLQLEALRRDLADRVMTEQVIRPLIELNFGPGEVPIFEFESQPIEAFRSGRLV